jgi:hypothetical protein
MGQVFVRSSLRSGALLTAGVVDAGYEGAPGALLDVRNPAGLILCKDAKLGQIILHQLEERVAGYHGIYQFSASSPGRDGRTKLVEALCHFKGFEEEFFEEHLIKGGWAARSEGPPKACLYPLV